MCRAHCVDSGASALDLAAVLYARSAAHGHPTAEYAYGLALLHGQGVPRDAVQGRRWLERAAAQGEREVMAAGWARDALQALDEQGATS